MWFYIIKDTTTGDVVLSETAPTDASNCLYKTTFIDLALNFLDASKTSHKPITAQQTALGLNPAGNNKRSRGAPVAVGAYRRTGGKDAYIDSSNLIVRQTSHIPPRRIGGRLFQ
jgi:hypothetical protein